jgi:hypothetical protein
MSLFLVQDGDRPMWVIALSFAEAVRKWRELIAEENGCAEADVAGPTGIQHICDDDEFIA